VLVRDVVEMPVSVLSKDAGSPLGPVWLWASSTSRGSYPNPSN
jgi:hypothetical protein